MNFQILKNKNILLLALSIGIFLAGLIMTIIFSVTSPSDASDTNTDFQVIAVDPASESLLSTQTSQRFELTLSSPISPKDIEATLSQRETGTTTFQSVTIQTEYDPIQNIFVVRSQEPIKPYSEYELTLKNKKTNSRLFKATYVSVEPQPAPVTSNNQELRSYLPYETTTYKLSYLESRNIYIFNLKLDPASPATYQTQFERAQQQAKEYIESKGIDLDTVTIEWRRS